MEELTVLLSALVSLQKLKPVTFKCALDVRLFFLLYISKLSKNMLQDWRMLNVYMYVLNDGCSFLKEQLSHTSVKTLVEWGLNILWRHRQTGELQDSRMLLTLMKHRK